MIVNRAELSQAMGVSLPTVDRWVRDGMPVKQRGSKGTPWEFALADVVNWWGDRQRQAAAVDKPTNAEDAKLRKLVAEAELVELELAKAKGEIAPVRDFERAQARAMAVIRQNIMNVPARAVLRLLGETDESTFKATLRAELALALEQSANADDLAAGDDDDEEPDDTDT